RLCLQSADHRVERKWEEIYAFISAGSNPSGYDKAQRQNLRRYASKFQQKELFVGTRRVVKTMDDARKLFHEFHSSPIGGHTGTHKTLNAVCSRFYWFGMTVDIKTWVCINCLHCLWELIGIDLTGPLPKTSSVFNNITYQNNWDLYLDPTLFSLRSKVHTTTKYSPFFLMYGREAVFPSEVPAQSESEAQHAVKETAQENIAKSQDKQKVAYAKQVLKKYKNVVYNVGDQILLLNMRKRGRKGGRLEPDFSGPYTIDDISGKCVGPKNAEGNTLKSLYSIDHIKPYRTSHPVQVSTPTEPVESSPSSEMQPCSPQHHPEALQNNRPSVIQFAPKIAQVKSVQAPEELVPVTPQKPST
uniref:Integrase zinc-binding domain-containing protein n=1 Tax=Oreochromis aureus TaxID=47969 RepID=A0AAZ1Y2T2_OREAU